MSDRILVATRKGLFEVARKGSKRWDVSPVNFLGDHVSMVLPGETTFAALHHGHFGTKLHRSADRGKTWAECATPAFPEVPEGTPPEFNLASGLETPRRVMMVWALETGGPDRDGVLLCGTIPGGLFVSRDNGDSWTLVESLWEHPLRKEWVGGGADYPGIHSISVDPRDSNRIAVGVSCGGVWVTEDNLEHWDCRASGMWAAYMPPDQKYTPHIQDPHRVVQCGSSPDTFWAQHHNGVFRTSDGAASWHEVKDVPPSTFGFAVAVHPEQPDTAWLVPGVSDEHRIPVDGRLVVTRTRDGGETFDVLTQGLPEELAYDLTFRHALDVDESGNRLVFGSTTGGLWVTEDGGDSWTCVSTHLPPVYCTRFVA